MDQIDKLPETTKMVAPDEKNDGALPVPPNVTDKWSQYLSPQNWSTLMSNNMLIYGSNMTIWYLA